MPPASDRIFGLDDLVDNLQVEQLDTYLFRGDTKVRRTPRVFGGQVLAQVVSAATRTLTSERYLHSLHAYFLRPGDVEKNIIFEVDPIRDGGSFTTRRVVARQSGKAILNASMSFQKLEQGLEHQMDMPEVPGPEGLQTDWEYWESISRRYPGRLPEDVGRFRAIDARVIQRRDLDDLSVEAAPVQGMWVKANGTLSDDPAVHRMILAYASDMQLMGTSLRAHPVHFWTPGFQGASLDHAMWFHCDFRADKWLYYHMDSPRAGGARGFNRGSFYTRDGKLVASAAQEGLIRFTPDK
ncbi:acyl-CoA thioesterase II [Exilibacterium tricleocarpae]|uniref:Acyl-CoA thioesterase 2 n=1 Tax=Exilibacterium tricleocarpae TaxID=2591008 RepID=A0A545TZ91_9GAMM|nr:acyl-CoA thioesterase II [Exilibacterium tricleocarpae]TQV82540.1 acyl-CoA thioesterase II [Exilibacterium tricleocarpae]